MSLRALVRTFIVLLLMWAALSLLACSALPSANPAAATGTVAVHLPAETSGPAFTLPPPTDTPRPSPTLPPPTDTPRPTATESPPIDTPVPAPIAPSPTLTTNSPATEPTATARSGSYTPTYTYRVIRAYPHDQEAWTQGLIYERGFLYEGTGLRGRSSLRRVDLESGEILQLVPLHEALFGEGVTALDGFIYQLTWQEHVGFVYDQASFELLQTFTYPTEGWGLTHNGSQLIMSDGTAMLHFLDPKTLQRTGGIEVHDENGPVVMLNELEYIDGQVYANIWMTDRIVRIDPATGQVTANIDLTGLWVPEDPDRQATYLNGIAFDTAEDRLFVTGKLWPKLFEIELVPVDP